MSAEPFLLRHRPQTFAEVHGHKAAIGALERRLRDPVPPHLFLFTGPSGVGKTTLARLAGRALNADIAEFDAAVYSGVDDMRSVLDLGGYSMPNPRLIVIDECHRLSKNAWDASLRTFEEPPPLVYFAVCTTELAKIPETIRTRAYHVPLNRLSDHEIEELLVRVIIAEGWYDMVDPGVFDVVVDEANGSARQALSLLQVCYDAPDATEASRIISLQGGSEPMLQVLEIVLRGQGSWSDIRPLLAGMPAEDFTETTLIGACRYVSGWLLRADSEAKARRCWEMLAYMIYPVHSFDPKSVFIAAIGRMLWSSK